MKACVLIRPNDIKCEKREKPKLKSGEVLVKIGACGICSSDLNRVFRNGAYHYPIVLGHEFSGEIVEVDKDVPQEYIGKHIVGFPLIPCNNCEFCKKGQYAQCLNYSYFGSRCDGAMAEYLAVPLWNVNIMNDNVPFEIAALTEPMAVAIHAAKKICTPEGKTICIIGTGTIGIMCGIYLRECGANVIFKIRNEQKKEILSRLGFVKVIEENTINSHNVDITIECVGSNQAIEEAIEIVNPRGQVILVGNPTEDLRIPKKSYWKILRSELSVSGVWNSDYANPSDDWKTAIDFLTEKKEIIMMLITHKFALEDVSQAFEIMNNKSISSIKGVMINV